jgi:hypothetical protein
LRQNKTKQTKKPKKSIGRDGQAHTDKQETKQINKQTNTKLPGSGRIEFQSY